MARALNATAASLLGLLHDGPMSGWELMTAARDRLGNFWSLTQSQVYRELAALQGAGLLRAGPKGARERQPFTLTDEGRAAFRSWLEQPPATENIRYPLLLTVAFGRHLPRRTLRRLLTESRQIHADRLAGYEQAEREVRAAGGRADPHAVATLRFGINHERATLNWFDEMQELFG